MSGPAVSKLVFFAYPNNAFSFKNHVPLPCVFIGLFKEEEEEYTQVYIFHYSFKRYVCVVYV